jgi:fatty acid-binding protein DegV
MRDAEINTLYAPRTEQYTLSKRVAVTRENATVRVMVMAGTDLDQEFRTKYHVSVVPVLTHLGRTDMLDRGDQSEVLRAYSAGLVPKPQPPQPFGASVNQIRDFILERIAHDWTQCVLIVPALAHNRSLDVAVQAAQQVSLAINRLRKSSVVPLPFQLAVIESGVFSSGTGVLAFDAVARSHVGLFGDRLVHHLEGMRKLVHMFVALKDYSYLEADPEQLSAQPWDFPSKVFAMFGYSPALYVNFGRTQAVKRLRGYEARMNYVLQRCIDGIESGLKTPGVCVSYAGQLSAIEQFERWHVLAKFAREKRIRLMATPMSISEAARLGPGTLTVSFASANFRP